MTAPALELRGMRKRFGPVQALRGVDFTLMPGELHAVLGENGAGKTTLMHVAYGLARSDAGEIRVHGTTATIPSPRAARRLGIGMVHQHFTSVPALTVSENVALAAGWPVAPRALRLRVLRLSERIGLPLDPDATAGSLTVGLKQRLEIVKALATDTRILLLDEPTAVLAPGESEELLRVVRSFAAGGGSAVLITHKLDEVLAAADTVTVLRQGSVVFTGPVAGQTATSLASAMLGRGSLPSEKSIVPGKASPTASPAPGKPMAGQQTRRSGLPILLPLVRVEALDVAREGGIGIAVRNASIAVHAGEIVGVAAVEGNGQRELLRAVAGRTHAFRGKLEVAGPVGFIPEDRSTEGLILEFTLTENVALGGSDTAPWIRRHRIDWRAAREYTKGLLAEYGIVAAGPDAPAASLSGGNQQKVVAARELSPGPRVIVAEDPTRGLDIRATREIHARIRAAAAAGAAVLLYSSDLDEVLGIADRVVVMARGTLTEAPPGASRAAVGEMMVTGGG